MSDQASISTTLRTLYEATVYVPQDVWEEFGHTSEYHRFSHSHGDLDGSKEQSSYSDIIETFLGHSRQDAETWIHRWTEQIAKWQAELANPAYHNLVVGARVAWISNGSSAGEGVITMVDRGDGKNRYPDDRVQVDFGDHEYTLRSDEVTVI